MNNPLAPNGRKRRLTPLRQKIPDPTTLPFQPVKLRRLEEPHNMAHLPGSNNHKVSVAGSGGENAGFNKKGGQGKKLVIKNRKGVCVCVVGLFEVCC